MPCQLQKFLNFLYAILCFSCSIYFRSCSYNDGFIRGELHVQYLFLTSIASNMPSIMLTDTSTEPPLLRFNQLGCMRDSRVLFAGVDYLINAGDIVQIEGPNGMGKTTLLRALTGLFPDYDGEILWRGQLVTQERYDFLSHLLFIGHLPSVKKALTPRENLTFLAHLNGCYTVDQVDNALAAVGLYGYEDMPGHQLSAGQHRRVALARLYLSKALLWVLDEPFTALDTQGVEKLETLFMMHVQRGGCVIFTSHQPANIVDLRRLSLIDYRPSHKPSRIPKPQKMLAESQRAEGE
jgi:heme exporter protein A